MENQIELLKQRATNKSVLILEDDPLIIQGLTRLLSHFFTQVWSANTIDEALRVLDEQQADSRILIITDIKLGAESGVDFTCQVKKKNPKQRVIAISGTEERDIFIQSIRCGIDRFVLKPLENTELFDALISVLEKMDYDLELQKSKKLLEESREYALKLLEEQDQFLKNAIHEIHTPLAIIITNIDLLRMQNIQNESIDAIEAGSRIIQTSYEDMTYLMKKDRVEDVKSEIDLVNFISERKNYFHCIAEMNELKISMFVGQARLPHLLFSELKLARLVDNTLSNAIKYSHRPSEVIITVGLTQERVFFEVRNYGPVIEDTQKIFERFHRESDHKGGYGLGLNIVAQICEEENIDKNVSSSAQRGTSFRYIFHNATQLQHNSSTIAISK
ncbi:MAG: hybrid sensor histidine kinase/response regulator [Helicobacteraceae bacterium]|nr:hybrid sensor histidine kinase/response regulator [Helicobacteraceae bacterium]